MKRRNFIKNTIAIPSAVISLPFFISDEKIPDFEVQEFNDYLSESQYSLIVKEIEKSMATDLERTLWFGDLPWENNQ